MDPVIEAMQSWHLLHPGKAVPGHVLQVWQAHLVGIVQPQLDALETMTRTSATAPAKRTTRPQA